MRTKVTIAMRTDGEIKRGGDVIQALQYKSVLLKLGYDIDIVYGDISQECGEIVHVFNFDRPWEALRQARLAKKFGAKVVLSAIHHPVEHILRYRYRSGFLFEKIALRCGFTLNSCERFKSFIRQALLYRSISGTRDVFKFSLIQAQIDLVKFSDAVQLLATEEGQRIYDITKMPLNRPRVIYNGGDVTKSMEEVSIPVEIGGFIQRFPRFAVVAGRVEPRKNQLSYCDAIQGLGIPTIFLGQKNTAHASYVNRFERAIDSSSLFIYGGVVPRDVLIKIFEQAFLHVSVSLFEVSSLVDIEAANTGCHVISSSNSYSMEYGKGVFEFCDPFSILSIRESVQRVWAKAERPKVPDSWASIFSWEKAGHDLHELYTEVLS